MTEWKIDMVEVFYLARKSEGSEKPRGRLRQTFDRFKEKGEMAILEATTTILTRLEAKVFESKETRELRKACKGVKLKRGYKIVPAADLDIQKDLARLSLLTACQKTGPGNREGIVILKGDKVIGAWEFRLIKSEHTRTAIGIKLIRISTLATERVAFVQANHTKMSEAMFKAILQIAKINGAHYIEYGKSNQAFGMMMTGFVNQDLILNGRKEGENTRHTIQ